MSTFITRGDERALRGGAGGVRLAVKDAIDVAGLPTTVGSPVMAERAEAHGPATRDAACMAGARAVGARIVGKTNLHELCFGSTGVNLWFGTPVNPIDPSLVPGGSSSGSAVAVAIGEADVAFGTDTVGSIRNPSACCGTVGLKTTWGRVSLEGVWPLAPTMDTVGPMACTVAGVVAGMGLLEPGFSAMAGLPDPGALRVGRFRGLPAAPGIDEAIDEALSLAGFARYEVDLPGWAAAAGAAVAVMLGEALECDRPIFEHFSDRMGDDVRARFEQASQMPAGLLDEARAYRDGWRAELASIFGQVDLIALPAMLAPPARIGEHKAKTNVAAAAVSLAGHPATAQPVPFKSFSPTRGDGGPVPASLQLVGPDRTEALLLAAAATVEAAIGS